MSIFVSVAAYQDPVLPFTLQRAVQQSFPAWLDITVLTQELRLCRGNAGTIFALLRRPDLAVADFLDNH